MAEQPPSHKEMIERLYDKLATVVGGIEDNDLNMSSVFEARRALNDAECLLAFSDLEPTTELPVWDDNGILDKIRPVDIQDYLKTRVPRGKENFKGTIPETERKTYLRVNPVHLIDRSTTLGEAAWMNMVTHHLFPGHSSCNMVFEQFYGECENLDVMLGFADIKGKNTELAPFRMLMTAWLNDNGYRYRADGKLTGPDGELYDGVLLDICW